MNRLRKYILNLTRPKEAKQCANGDWWIELYYCPFEYEGYEFNYREVSHGWFFWHNKNAWISSTERYILN